MSQRPHSSRRRGRSLDSDEYSMSVPFTDADVSEGELPRAELDEFVVPGSDEKGRKVTVSCNIPPMLDRQLDIVINSRRFPYANKKDFIRHAIYHHTQWILGVRQSIPKHHMAFYESSLEVARDDEYATRQEQVFLTLNERIIDHIDRGETQEARRLISIIDQKLRQLKPSLWVRRFAERFYRSYNSWLKTNVTEMSGVKKTATASE